MVDNSLIGIMKVFICLSLLLAASEISNAGKLFKPGFIKGALKGKLILTSLLAVEYVWLKWT